MNEWENHYRYEIYVNSNNGVVVRMDKSSGMAWAMVYTVPGLVRWTLIAEPTREEPEDKAPPKI